MGYDEVGLIIYPPFFRRLDNGKVIIVTAQSGPAMYIAIHPLITMLCMHNIDMGAATRGWTIIAMPHTDYILTEGQLAERCKAAKSVSSR
jgi:hypothetical protein